MSWHKKEMGNPANAYWDIREIQKKFMVSLFKNHYPEGMTLHSSFSTKDGNVTLYFSPIAKPFAESINATPCEKPSSDIVSSIIAGIRETEI